MTPTSDTKDVEPAQAPGSDHAAGDRGDGNRGREIAPDGEEEAGFLDEEEGDWENEPPDGEESWSEPEDEPE